MTKFYLLSTGAIFAYAGNEYIKLPYRMRCLHDLDDIIPSMSAECNVVNITKSQIGLFSMHTGVEALSPNQCTRAARNLIEDNHAARAFIDMVIDHWLEAHFPSNGRMRRFPLRDYWRAKHLTPMPYDFTRGFSRYDLFAEQAAYNDPYAGVRFEGRILTSDDGAKEFAVHEYNSQPKRNPHKEKAMNIPKQAHLLALLQSDMTTINVRFPDDNGRSYTYKCTLAQAEALRLDLTADRDPWVVVPGSDKRHALAVALVVTVDDEAQIDLDASYEYKWIVDIVNTRAYEACMLRERKAKDVLRNAERMKQREKLMELVGLDPSLQSQIQQTLNGIEAPKPSKEPTAVAGPAPTYGGDTTS